MWAVRVFEDMLEDHPPSRFACDADDLAGSPVAAAQPL